ncbi:MAG: hypothetical protein V4610_07010 [Pseudomonadota bacterium]
MSGTAISEPVDQIVVEAAKAAPTNAINMPDHRIREQAWYQAFVRLARPTLDWITNATVAWTMILQPLLFDRFDITAAGMSLAWAGTVYGFKFAEKIKGVA